MTHNNKFSWTHRILRKHLIVLFSLALCFGGFIQPSAAIEPPIWEVLDNPWSDTYVFYNDVVFINETHGWVTGRTIEGIGGGTILHTDDGGTTWQEQHHDASQAFQQIAVIDQNTLWVTGRGGLVYTTDGGQTWQNSTTIGPGSGLLAVIFANASHGWTSTKDILYNTVDCGQTWQNVSSWGFDDNVRDFYVQDSEMWAIGFYGIYYSNDLGGTWEQLYNQGGGGMSFPEDGGAWAVDDNMLAYSVDRRTWVSQQLPRPSPLGGFIGPYLSGIFFIDSSNGWLGGTETPVAYTPNGGLDWYDQEAGGNGRIMAFAFINQTHGWAVGSNSVILRTTRGNTIGVRLWKGLTDHVILLPLAALVVGVIIIWKRFPRRRRMRDAIDIE